jgi:hypothetical protein
MSYSSQLEQTKAAYPFDNWRENGLEGMDQYTPENCNAAQAVLDQLINQLITLGPDASETDKVRLFKTAIEALNALNEEIDSLIETGEREDLCELLDQITVAAGLDPKQYGSGEGIADEWREW